MNKATLGLAAASLGIIGITSIAGKASAAPFRVESTTIASPGGALWQVGYDEPYCWRCGGYSKFDYYEYLFGDDWRHRVRRSYSDEEESWDHPPRRPTRYRERYPVDRR